jgi:hypothetical protein
MKTAWTLAEWQAGRARRRRIADLISPAECGRSDSRDDSSLRKAFRGRRNLKFATSEELRGLSKEKGPK